MSKHNIRFVEPDPKPPRLEIIAPTELPPAPITEPMPLASHYDRARGFTLATAPLAAATGFVVLLIGIAGFGVPVLSVAALLLALAGFTVAWLCAYIVHTMVSVEGSLLVYTLSVFAYLKREQKERFRRYGKR